MTDTVTEIDKDLRRADGSLRLNAYYYGFDATGVIEVDRILAAVAIAGKGYHHTEHWSDDPGGGELSPVEKIQMWALRAAEAITQMRTAPAGTTTPTDAKLSGDEFYAQLCVLVRRAEKVRAATPGTEDHEVLIRRRNEFMEGLVEQYQRASRQPEAATDVTDEDVEAIASIAADLQNAPQFVIAPKANWFIERALVLSDIADRAASRRGEAPTDADVTADEAYVFCEALEEERVRFEQVGPVQTWAPDVFRAALSTFLADRRKRRLKATGCGDGDRA